VDETKLDALARSLAAVGTRRGLLRRGMLATVGAALAGAAAGGRAAALTCRGRGDRCRRDRQCCSGSCRRNGTCAPAGVGDPCDPGTPDDCGSGVCGCLNIDPDGNPVRCTCRQATCSETGEGPCAARKGCCTGFCLEREGRCFPPVRLRSPDE